jgi:gliding motility-associated-like protein
VLLAVFFCFSKSFGAVTITAPSLTITTCSFPSGSFTLGNFVITENVANDISTFGTVVLSAPANFEFTSAGSTSFTGADISSVTSGLTNASTITITINGSGTATINTVTISNIQVRAITGASGSSSVIRDASSTSVIAGNVAGDSLATLSSVLNSISGGTISAAQTICSGGNPASLSFSGASSGAGALTYQWASGIDGSTFPTNLGTANTYDPPAGLATTTYYRCVTTSTLNSVACAANSNAISVTVNPLPSVTNSAATTVCSGSAPNISLTSNIASSYSWTIGTVIGGVTGASANSGAVINQTLTNSSNSVTGSVEYLVTPVSTLGSCTGSTFTITVTVYPTPVITNPTTASICSGSGSNISLTSSVASSFSWTLGTITGSITGASASSGGTINQPLTNPSNVSAGTVPYFVTPTSTAGSCIGAADTITITVNPTPLVTNTATKSICSGAGSNISLASSAASNFTWTLGTITGNVTGAVAGSGSSINQTLTNPSSSANGSVQYIITPTSTGGSCVGAAYTITVTVYPTPVVSNAATKSICSGVGTNISLSASTASSFTWTVGGIVGSITGSGASSGSTLNQTLTNPSNTTSGTVDYSVTPTSTAGSCVGSALTITVTIYPSPVVTASATATVCSGSSPNISLTSSVASSFSWALGTITGGITGASVSSGAAINQTLTNPSNITAGTVPYIVTPTSTAGSCVGALDTIIVTVNPIPTITNTATKSICSGSSTNISIISSAASNFTWTVGSITGGITGSAAGSGSVINQTLTNPSSSATGTVPYVITPTSTGGTCVGSPFTITVTVYPNPVVSNSATKTICSGAGTNISLIASTASSFAWTIGGIVGSITGSSANSGSSLNQTLTNPSNTSAGTVDYVVTPTSTAGFCAGSAFTITVTVNPGPAVTSSSTATVCSGSGPAISLTAGIASNFSWTLGTITGGITGASASSGSTINQTLSNPSTVIPGTVPYIVVATSTSGSCVGPNDTITVTVNPTPTVTNSSSKAICSGTTTNISLTSSTGSNFTWTIGTVSGGITGASAGSGASINQLLTNPSNAFSGSVQYIVTPTSTGGLCVGSPFTITVTVYPTPSVTNSSTKSICNSTGTTLFLSASTASSFTWTIGAIVGSVTGSNASSGSIINQTLVNPSNSNPGSVDYVVTPTASLGSCVGSAFTITVTVNPTPIVTTGSTATVCSGNGPNITLAASVASSFSWTLGTIIGSITGASASSGGSINQTLTNPSNVTSGTVPYFITPTSTSGSCVGVLDTITVTVNPAPIVTNAATKSICSGANTNISLTSSAASNFVWTLGTITGGVTGAVAGSGGSINQILTNPSSAVNGSVQYIVTPTSTGGTCVGPAFTITVTVYPIPAVNNASTKSICSGAGTNISLTASAASSFTWTVGGIVGSITGSSASSGSTLNQTLINPSNVSAGSIDYVVTPTSTVGSCVGSAFTITVTVNPIPLVTTAATATICSGNNTGVSLTSSIASSFSWTLGTITGSITGALAGSGNSISQTLNNPSNTIAGTVPYIVTPTSTGGSCAGVLDTIIVTVNPAPAITNSATKSICSGASTNISINSSIASNFTWTVGTITGSITGASAGSGSTINQILSNPSNSVLGTVQYIITPTSTGGSCVGAAFTITVTVNPTPVVSNSATATTCSGVGPNISLTASVASSFSWTIGAISGAITGSGASSGAIINQALTNPSNSSAGSVEYIVTPTSTSGACVGSALTLTVTVNPAPAVTTTSSISICSATATGITLTASIASSYSWTLGMITGSISGAIAGSGASINQTLTNPSSAVAGTVAYIITPVSGAGLCAGSLDTIVVTVNPIPTVTNAASKSICSGVSTNIALTASVASSYTWTIGAITGGITGSAAGSGSTINQVHTNPSNVSSGTVEYIVTPISTGGVCTGATYTITVSVDPIPVVSNASTKAICSGTSTTISLASTVASNFSWTIGAITGSVTGASASSGGTINQTLINPSSSVIGTVQYLVTPTSSSGGCVGAAYTITVSVSPAPTVTNPATVSICSGTSTNMTLTSSVASTFTWTIGAITGSITGASGSSGGTINQTLVNSSNTTDGTVKYIITPTSVSGSCLGIVDTITVIVTHAPALTNSATASTCSGVSPTIALTANEASTFTWAIGSTTGGITGASASSGATINQILTNPSNISSGTVQYLVTPTSNASSCAGLASTITITVYPLPVLTNVLTDSICSGSSTNVSFTSSVPSSFTWTLGAITGGITGASAGSGVTIVQTLTNPSATTAGVVRYVVTPTSTTGSCAGVVDTVKAIVNVAPVAVFTGGTAQTVCSGIAISTAITLSTSNSIAGTTFAWTRNNTTNVTGTLSGSGDISGLVLTNTTISPQTVTITVIPTGPSPTFCVGAAITTTILVNPAPDLSSSLLPSGICSGGTFAYAATSTLPSSSYTWSRGAVAGIIPATNSGVGDISEALTNSTTSPINVTYVYHVTANGCTNPTAFSVVLAVNVYPSVSSNLYPSAICSGSTFSYTPTSLTPNTSYTWTRAAVSGISNLASSGMNGISEILNDTLYDSVLVHYAYTSTANNCVNPIKDTVAVYVKAPALLNSGLTPAAVCSGTLFSYMPTSLTAGATFAWSRAAVINISNPTASGSNNPNETLVNTSTSPVPVTYVYTITANGCSYNQNVVVVVNPIPVLTSSFSPPAICSGTAFNYTPQSSTAGAGFAWSRASIIGISNPSTSGIDNPNEVLVNTTTSSIVVQYVYTVSANGCTNASTYSVNVAVSLVPSLSSSLSLPAICSGAMVSYTPTSGTSATIFSWARAAIVGISNIAGSGTDNPSEPLTNVTTDPINVTYVYTLTANGCTNPSTFSVVVPVNPTPVLSSSLTPAAVCSGSAFNYTATSPTTGALYTWTRAQVTGISNAASSGSGNISEILINTTTDPIGVIYVYTVVANGCSSVFNVNLTVNPIPVLTSTLTPGATCSGNMFSYNPQSTTLGASFDWTRAAVAGISNASNSGVGNPGETLIDTISSPVNNVTYIYTVSANGCTNPTAYNVVITVNPTPLFTSSFAPPAICSGTAFNYTPTSATVGTAFLWTRTPVSGISNIGGSGSDSPNEVLTNTSTDSVNVTYVYTLAANGCTNPTTYSVIVTVYPTPLLSSSLLPSAICSGTAFSYAPQSLSPGASFTWSRVAVAGIANISSTGIDNPNELLFDTTSAQQNVTYVYTTTAKGCSGSNNIVVMVNPNAALTSTLLPAAICSGSTFSYIPQSSTLNSSFAWTRAVVAGISNTAGGGNGNPNEVLVNTQSTPVNVTYVYTVSANSCTNPTTYSVVVSVNPVPVFTSSLAPPALCSGTTFSYVPTSSVAGASYTWTRAAVSGISNTSGSGVNNPNEILTNTTTSPVNVKYIFTSFINGCANSINDTVVVSVIPTPVLISTATPNAICSGTRFSYLPTSQLAGVTYSWTRAAVPGLSNIGSSGTDSISETLTLSDTIPVNVTYIFTLSTSSCTNVTTFPVVLTVNKPCFCNHQLTSASKPPAICSNTLFSYVPTSSSSGAAFAWTRAVVAGISNAAASGNGNPNETLINTTAAPVDVVYVYAITAGGCTNPVSFSVMVTVNPIPTLTSTLSPASICSGAAFIYTPTSGTPGATFTWSRAVVTGISTPSAIGTLGINEVLTSTLSSAVNAVYVYTVSANSCINATTYSVTVVVNPTPSLSSSLTPAAICSGTTFSYTPTSATPGVAFTWSRGPITGISEQPANGVGNPNEVLTNLVDFPLFVTYSYTISANGCSRVEDVFVAVNPKPTLLSSLTPAAICSGAAFNYTPASGTAGAAFAWTRAVVTNISNPASSGNGNPNETLINTSADPVNVTYAYTLSANACTNATAYSVIVTVNPLPNLNSTLTPTTTCSGASFSYLPTSATAGASFVWNRAAVVGISNPVSSGTGNPLEALVDTTANPVSVTYQYIVSANGCTNPTAYNVVVSVDPFYLTANAGNDVSLDAGSSVTLHGSGGVNYSWAPITGLDNPNSANPILTPQETANYILTVTDGKGCVGVDTVLITVEKDHSLIISNVMTPNGDGKNDTWIIVNIEAYPNTEVIVVNIQGQQVYFSGDYDNSWDGKYNGKQLPDGTYYYFLKFAGGGKVYSGAISIFNH